MIDLKIKCESVGCIDAVGFDEPAIIVSVRDADLTDIINQVDKKDILDDIDIGFIADYIEDNGYSVSKE